MLDSKFKDGFVLAVEDAIGILMLKKGVISRVSSSKNSNQFAFIFLFSPLVVLFLYSLYKFSALPHLGGVFFRYYVSSFFSPLFVFFIAIFGSLFVMKTFFHKVLDFWSVFRVLSYSVFFLWPFVLLWVFFSFSVSFLNILFFVYLSVVFYTFLKDVAKLSSSDASIGFLVFLIILFVSSNVLIGGYGF